MKTLAQLAAASFLVGIYVGCSPVKFSLDEDKCKTAGENCVVENNLYTFDDIKEASAGKVDILIVNDNSASMSFEQKALANRFSGFIQALEARSADYRIAMTTTDVHVDGDGNDPRPINGAGTIQNGNLLSFGGYAYLTKDISNRVSLFNSTVVRPETRQCEDFIANWIRNNGVASTENSSEYARQYKANCPSGDERGVYAATLAIQNNPSSFIRKDAHLAVIFLSDEDVRSQLYYYSGYGLANLDQPATLVSTFTSKYGTGKGLSVHAITVKDSSCLAEQNNQVLGNPAVEATRGFVQGTFGTVYQTFTNQNWGKSVSICSLNYTNEIGAISTDILQRIDGITLNCSAPIDLVVSAAPGSAAALPSWTRVGKQIKFATTLTAGTKVRVAYKCSKLD